MDVFEQLAELARAQRRLSEKLDKCVDTLYRLEQMVGNVEECMLADLGDVRVMPTAEVREGALYETH